MTHTFYVPKGIDYDKQVSMARLEVEKGKKVEFHDHGVSDKNCTHRCWTTTKPG